MVLMRTKENGITLIALVITVIILLILAGVAMSLITGPNGLFARANQAGSDYKQSARVEADKVNYLPEHMSLYEKKEYVVRAMVDGEENIIGLWDEENESFLSFDEIYLVINNQEIDMTSYTTHRVDNSTVLESFRIYDFFDDLNKNFWSECGFGNHEFIIIKDGIKYKGSAYVHWDEE